MCRSEKSFSELCGCGEVGGGRMGGSSVALVTATARNDSNRAAVTRDAEVQSGRRRIMWIVCLETK